MTLLKDGMVCLPNDTQRRDSQGNFSPNWLAYAYVDHWFSAYKSEYCTYPSFQMHEIGHNMGLVHSGEDSDEYGDQSGLVSTSINIYKIVILSCHFLICPSTSLVLLQ